MKHIEIISVGNELLIGKTLNTNAHWLARRATTLGVTVKRVTVVGDDVNEISQATKEALNRDLRLIIVTGGLGPTYDDKTLDGIANALNRKLKVSEEALKLVKEKHEAYSRAGNLEKQELTPPRMKMARLPEGSKPLRNPIGTAPGVRIDARGKTLIALPGVPDEMKAIFEESIEPLLRKEADGLAFVEASIFADGIMESSLAPLIDIVTHDNPRIYVKSHPKGEEGNPHLEIHFSTASKNTRTAKEQLERAMSEISELIKKNGGEVRTEE